MTGINQQMTMTTKWMFAAMFLLMPLGNVGCSSTGAHVLSANLESRVSSPSGTADDHLAAALLYQQEAQRAQAEATKYKQAAASIGSFADPKGFRRSGLITAAQTHQHYASEMQQLYAAHQAQAETMLGKQQSQ